MDNLNCKTQAHARVCEENTLQILPMEIILWWRYKFEGPYSESVGTYQDNILKDDSP